MESASNNYEIINGRKVVKKHVATIHCSNKLSLLERKISNALLYNAYPNLKNTLVHEISLEQLKRLLNIRTRNHKVLKDSLRRLITTLIEWNILGEDIPELDGWNSSTILSSVSIQNRIIKYQYSELIKSLIIDPKIYGKINLIIQSRFRSSYALALYENCSRYRGLKYTKKFSFIEFRMLMGVEDGKYELFRDFNRRVLSPAITEINTCSDIRVTPDIIKKGRKVSSIKFTLEERKMKQRLGADNNNKVKNVGNHEIKEIAKDFSIAASCVKEFYTKYGEERMGKAVEYVKSRPAFKNGDIRNIGGYLKKTIENNFWSSLKKEANKVDSSDSKREEKANTILEDLRSEYLNSFLPVKIHRIFQGLPDEEKDKIQHDFIKNGKPFHGKYMDIAMKKGMDKFPIFIEGLSSFIYNRYPQLIEALPSIEDYIRREQDKRSDL